MLTLLSQCLKGKKWEERKRTGKLNRTTLKNLALNYEKKVREKQTQWSCNSKNTEKRKCQINVSTLELGVKSPVAVDFWTCPSEGFHSHTIGAEPVVLHDPQTNKRQLPIPRVPVQESKIHRRH